MKSKSGFSFRQPLLFLIVLLALAFALAFAASAAQANAAERVETADYAISPSEISLKSYLNAFKSVELNITNKMPVSVTVAVAAEGSITELLKLSNTLLTIPPFSSTTVSLTFLSTRPGDFNGTVSLRGEIAETLPVRVRVANSNTPTPELLAMRVEAIDKKTMAGKPFAAIVDLQNLLSGNAINVSVRYFLKREKGEDEGEDEKNSSANGSSSNSLELGNETFAINTSLSVLKVFETEEIGRGSYVFEARATYGENTLSSKTRFTITTPLLETKLLGLVAIKHVLFAVIAGVLLTGGVLVNKKRQLKKRRYVSKLYLDQLPRPGPRSVVIGKIAETNRTAYFDLDQLQLHTLVAGSTGGGKTVSAQVFIEEALMKGVSVIAFDPTAQWTGFLRKNAEKKMLALYPKFGLKPSDARSFNGNVRQISDAMEVIDIRKFMRPGEITVFAINKLEPEDIDVVVANTVRQVFRANLPESTELKLLIIFDEVHRLLPKFGGSGQGFLQIERATREFRKWGVGLFLISQVLTDFAGETKANITTEVQMRTRAQGDLDRIKTKYGDYMLQSLLKSATGTGMTENATYNKGEPYFVSFRPLLHNHAALADQELESYNKYNAVLDELEYQLEQLKSEGIDIFDLELDLKLAKDKLKTGNFNMVDIYLESLQPKLAEEWKKLGKKPKQYKAQLLSEEELKKEYEVALKARQKLVEEESRGKGKGEGEGEKEKPEFKPLRLKSGLVVMNPRELEDALQNMSQTDFSHHLNDDKNDFAAWAEGPEPQLAKKLREAKARQDVVKVLQEFTTPQATAQAKGKSGKK